MFSLKKLMAVAALAAGIAAGQPALTTIQDILYRADGTRFSGTLYITYNSFLAGDTSNIATANLTVPIVNGSLRVRLAPTTTSSAGAQYSVTYNSRGVNQFAETWAVPPTSATLRVRDVRLTSGSVVGPPPVISPVQIGDVIGLANELEVRPMRGVGFGIGRAAVINSAGQLDAAAGSLADCVRVDGTAGPCGGAGGSAGLFAENEVPAGAVNGSNTSFSLVHAPDPVESLHLYRNGLLLRAGSDYSLSGFTITFFIAGTPQNGDLLTASYRYGNEGSPGGLSSPQVVCSSVGANTSSTALTGLATCTVPAGLLGSGDRLEVRFQFGHSGTGVGFTAQVVVGSVTILDQSAGATETVLTGNADFGIFSSGQVWDIQRWGAVTSLAAGVGTAAEDTNQAITVQFRAQMAGATSETIGVRNFTVIRYPAQANP